MSANPPSQQRPAPPPAAAAPADFGGGGGERVLLAEPGDASWLTQLLCFVRCQLEVFTATPDDVDARKRKGGGKHPISVGRVGIRCIHCAHVPPNDRAKGAASYPKSIRLVHQAVRNWQRYHLNVCPYIPDELREMGRNFKRQHSGNESLRYWIESCARKGMVDTEDEDGILLRPPPVGAEATVPAAEFPASGSALAAAAVAIAVSGTGSVSTGDYASDMSVASSAASFSPPPATSAEIGRSSSPPGQHNYRSAGVLESIGELANFLDGNEPEVPARRSDGQTVFSEMTGAGSAESTPLTGSSATLEGGWMFLPNSSVTRMEPQPIATTSATTTSGITYPTVGNSEIRSGGGLEGDLILQSEGLFSNGPSHPAGLAHEGPLQDNPANILKERVQLAHDIVRESRMMRRVPPSAERGDGRSMPSESEAETREDLHSLGLELYELFAGFSPSNDGGDGDSDGDSDDEDEPTGDSDWVVAADMPKKRGKRLVASRTHIPLRELGLPYSLSHLVASLLNEEDDKEGQQYQSTEEVEEDLKLMTSDPERFLFDFDIDTIDYQHLSFPQKLYGREAQTLKLMNVCKQVLASKVGNEMILVSGYPGTGKSTLIKQTLGDLSTQKGVCFISGKFDELQQVQPFSAITNAFDEYCNVLLAKDAESLNQIRAAIMDSIDSDQRALLASLIPNLRKVIGTTDDTSIFTQGESGHFRLTFLFRLFLQTVSDPSHPIALFLDDLQWADEASLQLLRFLASDMGITSVLFLGSYRDNEVSSDHPLAVELRTADRSGVRITTIKVDDIDKESVNALVSDTLRLSPRMTRPLANVVFQKTNGNALFVVQFLRSLCDKGLLHFSLHSRRWLWNVDAIKAMDVADNVVELMTSKMLKLPSEVQKGLKIAACLGCQCEETTVKKLEFDAGPEECSLPDLLDVAVNEGLMSKVGRTYRFSHDQIQSAAYSLIPKAEQKASHLDIGRQLWKGLRSELQMEPLLYVVADQLYRGIELINDPDERIEFARLNLLAGKSAMLKSAFSPALVYFKAGTSLLGEDDWSEHYKLCLDLYNECAETEYIDGNVDAMMLDLDHVFTHANCFEDKVRAYYTLVVSLGAKSNTQNAIDKALEVLAQLGETFPSKINDTVISNGLADTQKRLGATTEGAILALDEMEDTHKANIMRFLGCLGTETFLGGRHALSALVAFRMVQLTLSHGVCSESALAFSMYGWFLCGSVNDRKGGYRFGKLSISLLDRFYARSLVCRVHTIFYACIVPWIEPLQSTLPPLSYSHDVGMATGDVYCAMINIAAYAEFALFSGRKLGTLVEEIKAFSKQMKEYKQDRALAILRVDWQTALNLMGRSKDPTKLTGEVMEQDELEKKKEWGLLVMSFCYQIWLAYLFGRYELAAEVAEKRGELTNGSGRDMSRFPFCIFTFYHGLSAIALARSDKQNKWRVIAQEAQEKMKVWAEDSVWNCQHKLELLNAEFAFLNGDEERATKYYDDAIRHAGERGFVNEQALVCERAAIFYSETGKPSIAANCFSRSVEYYLQWGAQSKADELREHRLG